MKGYYLETNGQFKELYANTLLGKFDLNEIEKIVLNCQRKEGKEWELSGTFVGFRLNKMILHIGMENLKEDKDVFVKVCSSGNKIVSNRKDVEFELQEKLKEMPPLPIVYDKAIDFPQEYAECFKGTVLSIFSLKEMTDVLNKLLPGGVVDDLFYKKGKRYKILIANMYYAKEDALKKVEIFADKKGMFCLNDELEDNLNIELTKQAKKLNQSREK